MKYMLLISMQAEDWTELATYSPEEIKAQVGYMNDLIDQLQANGEMLGGEGLGGPARMKVVQARQNGDALITDGPMAEAKEFLAGYFLVDVATPERAFEIAAHVSAAPGRDGQPANTPIQVHPVMGDPAEDPDLMAPYRT